VFGGDPHPAANDMISRGQLRSRRHAHLLHAEGRVAAGSAGLRLQLYEYLRVEASACAHDAVLQRRGETSGTVLGRKQARPCRRRICDASRRQDVPASEAAHHLRLVLFDPASTAEDAGASSNLRRATRSGPNVPPLRCTRLAVKHTCRSASREDGRRARCERRDVGVGRSLAVASSTSSIGTMAQQSTLPRRSRPRWSANLRREQS
jgi:hypothetical protein